MKTRQFILFLLLNLIFTNYSYSQFYDNNWIIGAFSNTYKNGQVNFYNGISLPNSDSLTSYNPFYATNSSMSDSSGNLLFYTNGLDIFDSTHAIMQNGNGLSPCYWTTSFLGTGLNLLQGSLALPFPMDPTKYYLFHQSWDLMSTSSVNYHAKVFYKSIIDMTLNNGLGAVINKNDTLLYGDTLIGQGITACKHANGRDWWLIHHKARTNEFIIWLINPAGISSPVFQPLGTNPYYTHGSSLAYSPVFSPDGTKFTYIAHGGNVSNKRIDYFNFDRCSGLFNAPQTFFIPDSSDFVIGTSFSPNSRYLYISSNYFIYQYDTWASNIDLTRQVVAVFDNHQFMSLYSVFISIQLAPNGKIYISSHNSPDFFGVINSPDAAGLACNVTQHSFNTNVRNQTLPNHPNYRLGRLFGSPCDTISNVNILKEEINISSIYPNPNNGSFKIMYNLPPNVSSNLILTDLTGREIHQQKLPAYSSTQSVQLNNIASGIYLCIIEAGKNSRVVKLVIK